MITLEALQVIDSIDRKGSFSAAAEELYRVPSALTYTVKKLEDQLNIKLFDRTKQRARLTPTGRLILENGRAILQQVKQLEEQAQRIETGWERELRIVLDTILPVRALWTPLGKLIKEQPWLNIRVYEEALSGSWEALVNQRADLIIGVTGDEPAGGLWERQAIGQVDMAIYCSKTHPAALLQQPLQLQQLQEFTHIIISDSARNLPHRNVGILGLKQILSVANMQQKIDALIHGLGISHLPITTAADYINSGELVKLSIERQYTPQTVFMAWPRNESGKANQWLRHYISQNNLF